MINNCLLPNLLSLLRNSQLLSALVGSLSSAYVAMNLHFSSKKLNLTQPSLDKSKFWKHSDYIVINDRSWKRSNKMLYHYTTNGILTLLVIKIIRLI